MLLEKFFTEDELDDVFFPSKEQHRQEVFNLKLEREREFKLRWAFAESESERRSHFDVCVCLRAF